MDDATLDGLLAAHADDRVRTHCDACHLWPGHAGCAVARLVAEVRRLRAEAEGGVTGWRRETTPL